VILVADWLPFGNSAAQLLIFAALVGHAIEAWRIRKLSVEQIEKRPMKVFALYSSLSLLLGGFAVIPFPLAQTQNAQRSGVPAPNTAGSNVVQATMKNVDFHLTDRIIVHIATLNGKLTPNQSAIPVFDNKRSFSLDVDSANITVSTTALSNDLNDYVFVKPDAPLKKLTVTTQGNLLILKGLLVGKGVPFETDGTVAVTPEGFIRVHTEKVKAFQLPVKGVMDLLGIDMAKLLNTNKVEGVTVDKDDLILDPQKILPPPQMRGRLTSIQIENGGIALVFGTPKGQLAGITSSCSGRNFLSFKGGSFRFGKLLMSDADLELIDLDPGDPFDFSVDRYKDQLVAGYTKMTQPGGLCVYMPDLNKVKQNNSSRQKMVESKREQ
jgi:hypothetical protein